MVGILFTQNDSDGFLDFINLIAFIELFVDNVINNHINIFELPQQRFELPFKIFIKLPKFFMLNQRTIILDIT